MSGHTVVLGRGHHVVGRGSNCAVVVDDPNLSRQHLLIDVDDDVVIEDTGSTNGTWVGGRRLARLRGAGARHRRRDRRLDHDPRVDGVANLLAVDAGVVPFNRPPRIEPPYVGSEFTHPGAAGRSARRSASRS